MHKQKTGMLICGGVGLLSCFLPWATVPIVGSINGMQGDDGIIMIVLLLPAVALALMGDKTQPLTGGKLHGAAIPAILASLLSILKVVDFNSKMGDADDNPLAQAMASTVSIGIGLYLLCVVGIVCGIIGYKMKADA